MVPRERASVVCVAAGKLLGVVLEDPKTGRQETYLPGGALEPGESPAAAARRETLEETGYDVNVDERSRRSMRYPFSWGGLEYDCTTHFFAAHLTTPDEPPRPISDASYHRGVVWVALADVPRVFGYHQGILSQILELLS